jgi:hypothetical protein
VAKRTRAVEDALDLSQTGSPSRLSAIDRLRRASPIWALRPLYRAYENRLVRQIEGDPIPRHIGIILDGNRRHGERHGVHDPHAIYAFGAHKLDDVLDWCARPRRASGGTVVFLNPDDLRRLLNRAMEQEETAAIVRGIAG